MHRLYKQFYLTIIASLLLVVLLGGMFWRFAPAETPPGHGFALVGELVAPHLPPADADAATQYAALLRMRGSRDLDLALFDKTFRPLAAVGRPLPSPRRREVSGWIYGRGGPAWAIRIPDGRWLVARTPGRFWHPVLGLIGFLGGIAIAVAVCAYPLVR